MYSRDLTALLEGEMEQREDSRADSTQQTAHSKQQTAGSRQQRADSRQ
jgi:hypothetical protein